MSFLTRFFGIFFKNTMNKILKKGVEELDTEEVKNAIQEYHKAREKANKSLEEHCKKNPDSFLCTERGRKSMKSTPWVEEKEN